MTKNFGKYGVVYNNKFENVLPTIEDGSLDCVIIDPPYVGYNGKNPVLAGHKIQTVIDLDLVCSEAFRVLKPNSFFAFFGQMPTIIDWYAAAKKAGFNFRIDIIWAKKKGGMGGNLQMRKSHELIYIVSKGTPNYNITEGEYSDVSQALIEYNFKDIESIFRQLSYWKGIAQGKELKNTTVNNEHNKDIYFIEKGLGNGKSKTLGRDTQQFNSVWAFSNHNLKHRNEQEGNIQHPSVKPIPLLERLIELLTFDNATVLDCFIGSGTTFLAGIRTGRKVIGVELFKEYFDITCNRIEKEIKLKEQNLF